ncbi:hypothetical protein R5W23_005233 [Gemmata sp. JC673]|uniref:Uncharacterized protein n=1 Tax=Gemmata algarum TaxID=2975278 RepID=A0ABU5F7V5_9BACT|nr:hypothetical protein [Gemmata algarum]MDY3563617.1 hypothetical protein [Gemmata algarum]
MAENPCMFLVARIGWCVDSSDGQTCQYHDLMNRAGEDRRFVPVAAFTIREDAERRMRELELEAARLFNPFWRIGPLFALASQPEALLPRLAVIAGSLPSDAVANGSASRRVWCEWWDEHVPDWSDETLWEVWSLFDQIRFYAVLEIEVGDE